MELPEIAIYLKSIPLYRDVAKSSQDQIVSAGTIRNYKKGEHLFWSGDLCEELFVVAEGVVVLYKMSTTGERKIIFTFSKGQIINEEVLQGMPASVSAEALAPAKLICLKVAKLLPIIQADYRVGKAIFDSLAQKMRRTYRQLKNTSNLIRGDKKIAAKLWKMAADSEISSKQPDGIRVNITITFLADMLGSKRESVSRQLKLLADQGLIRVEPKGLLIPDRDALAQYFKAP